MKAEPGYIEHRDIDKERWDDCIRRSPGGRIYAFSFYLDKTSPGWNALVWKDYEAVMPLTWKRKFGIRYLCQPFGTAQLGVMGTAVDMPIVHAFLEAIPRRYRYIDISLNPTNRAEIPGFPFISRMNLVLPLQEEYTAMQGRYNENLRRNLRKAEQAGLRSQRGTPVNEVIRLAIAQMKAQGQETQNNIMQFRELFAGLEERGLTETYGIYREEALLASAVFFFSHQRAYYILVGNDPRGRDSGASHMLIDSFIRDHAGQKLVLDFEGSDIPSLASFYTSYGAVPEPYPALRVNRLPFFLRWLKS